MAQLKHPNPNFTINSIKGWDTRLIYTCYGDENSYFDIIGTGYGFTDNIFYAINDRQQQTGRIFSKGQYIFPTNSRFFKSGKSIRVKGFLLVSTNDPNSIFNIYAGIKNLSTSVDHLISATNNFSDHTFSNGEIKGDVPISFEILYNCVETTDSNLYFQVNGFYKYEYVDYTQEGPNNGGVVYVPIWYNGNPYSYGSVGDISHEYELFINFNNSVYINSIKICGITIEELT